MEGSCPNCRTRLDFPRSGAYQCERCKSRFEVALGSPVAPAPRSVAPYGYSPPMAVPYAPSAAAMPQVTPGLDAPCVQHPSNPATGVCERCGDFMCRLCTTMVEGRAYCPKCFDLLYNRGSLQFAQRQFTTPATALTLGIIGLVVSLIPCLGLMAVPLPIAGLVLGFRGLKEVNSRPDLPGRKALIGGVTCSILGIIATVAWTITWVVLIVKN